MIKLLATSKKVGDQYYAMVSPVMIGNDNPLYSVNDVFNAIFVHGNMLGDAMFYGSGAGKLPTASAVVGDIVECAKHLGENVPNNWSAEPLNLISKDQVENRFFVRVSADEKAKAAELFGAVEEVSVADVAGEYAFVTGKMSEAAFEEKAASLNVISRIRARF